MHHERNRNGEWMVNKRLSRREARRRLLKILPEKQLTLAAKSTDATLLDRRELLKLALLDWDYALPHIASYIDSLLTIANHKYPEEC